MCIRDSPSTESYGNPNNGAYTQSSHDHALQVGQSFTDNNNRWKIEVTGKGGAGADAYLDVAVTDLLSPQITSQPTTTQSVYAGANITLSVSASGSGLTYQWQKQDPNGNWINIDGATAASLTLSGLTMELSLIHI